MWHLSKLRQSQSDPILGGVASTLQSFEIQAHGPEAGLAVSLGEVSACRNRQKTKPGNAPDQHLGGTELNDYHFGLHQYNPLESLIRKLTLILFSII